MIGSLLFSLGFMYFLVSFTLWKFNPNEWGVDTRMVHLILSAWFLILVLAVRFPEGPQTVGWF